MNEAQHKKLDKEYAGAVVIPTQGTIGLVDVLKGDKHLFVQFRDGSVRFCPYDEGKEKAVAGLDSVAAKEVVDGWGLKVWKAPK